MKPKVDFAFKELMTDETVRNGFLSAVLELKPEDIHKTAILNTELRRIHQDEKQGILDVHLLLNDDTEIDIEIQLSKLDVWSDRALYYLSKMFGNQLSPGEGYRILYRCINISILDFRLFADSEEFYSVFGFYERRRHTRATDKMEFHVIELPKLPEKLEKNSSDLLLWAKFISAEKKEEFEMLSGKNASIDKAYERLQVISLDRQKRMEYEAREKAVRDYNEMMMESRESGLELGLEQGLEQGLELGLERGRTEGLELGRAEGRRQEAVDIAKKLLASGVDEKIIAESTGLSLAQIEGLKE